MTTIFKSIAGIFLLVTSAYIIVKKQQKIDNTLEYELTHNKDVQHGTTNARYHNHATKSTAPPQKNSRSKNAFVAREYIDSNGVGKALALIDESLDDERKIKLLNILISETDGYISIWDKICLVDNAIVRESLQQRFVENLINSKKYSLSDYDNALAQGIKKQVFLKNYIMQNLKLGKKSMIHEVKQLKYEEDVLYCLELINTLY